MSSRFFMSDSESSESESEEIIKEAPVASNFLASFSDDDDDVKRVVRSARVKRFEEITNLIRQIKNFKKNKDLASLLTSFEDLCRLYAKAKPVIDKEDGGKVPPFYTKCLAELEDFINSIWDDKEARAKLNKNNSRGLATMRQKFRKYIKDFSTEISAFRENPDDFDSDIENLEADNRDQVDSDDDDDDMVMGPGAFKKDSSVLSGDGKFADDSDDSSTDWGSDSEISSSESDGENFTNIRDKFLKSSKKDDDGKKKDKPEKKPKKVKLLKDPKDGEWETVKKGSVIASEKPKMFGKDDEITVKSVTAKLTEIIGARGKKGTDRKEQIELVNELMKIAKENNLGEPLYIKIQYHLTMAIFDYAPVSSECMKSDLWEKVLKKIEELLEMLNSVSDLTIAVHITEEMEDLENSPYKIHGDVVTIIERMDEEFYKLLKAVDAHSNEFMVKLKDEVRVCSIIDTMLEYQERQGFASEICRIFLRKIEHTYFKYDKLAAAESSKPDPFKADTSLKLMERLGNYIFTRDTTGRLRIRAMLCKIYHLALHDAWYTARDVMLMSHVQDTIQHSDLPTQILYNRTLVQMGLCAFRHGRIREAHDALLDIQSGGRAKELLAQGLLPQRHHERTSEQEKQEKLRQIPFHMHINLEVVECVYLVSAMLNEIPYMAAHEYDARRRMISKSFHHQLKNSERQSLVGPPESMREHVVAASKAMRTGNWKLTVDLLVNEKMNGKVWDLFHNPDSVRKMLYEKVQEESLRTYLFSYSSTYDSISLENLAERFDLPLHNPRGTSGSPSHNVHAIISKMILKEEIMGSLDEPTQCLVMHRTEPSQIQSLSLQLADKLYNLVENNERVLDQKPFYTRNMQGVGGYRERQQKPWGRERDGGRDRRNDSNSGRRNEGRRDYNDRRSNQNKEYLD